MAPLRPARSTWLSELRRRRQWRARGRSSSAVLKAACMTDMPSCTASSHRSFGTSGWCGLPPFLCPPNRGNHISAPPCGIGNSNCRRWGGTTVVDEHPDGTRGQPERLTQSSPGGLRRYIHDIGRCGMGGREDGQEHHWLAKRVVGPVNLAFGDEDHFARFQYPAFAAAPLLSLTRHHVDNLLPRGMVMERMTRSGRHRRPHQKQVAARHHIGARHPRIQGKRGLLRDDLRSRHKPAGLDGFWGIHGSVGMVNRPLGKGKGGDDPMPGRFRWLGRACWMFRCKSFVLRSLPRVRVTPRSLLVLRRHLLRHPFPPN